MIDLSHLKGKIICFEGIDCSFKETNTKALCDALWQQNIKTQIVEAPNYENESSVYVRRFLAGKYGNPKDLDPTVISSFYMLDQFDHWSRCKGYYELGWTTIFDRSWLSNLYYQLVRYNDYTDIFKNSDEKIKHWKEIEEMANRLKLPVPNYIIKMKMGTENIIKLVKEKNSSNDIHESNYKFLADVNKNFQRIDLTQYCTNRCIDIKLEDKNGDIRLRSDIFGSIIKELTE